MRRLPALDIVRGVALLGILVVNLSAWTLPLAHSGLPSAADALDVLAWMPTKWLFETKFMVLFSLLFGMGAMLQLQGARRRGATFGRVFLRRMGLLAGIGLAHAALLWSGDILLHYAIVGLSLPLLLRLRTRTQLVLVGVSLFIPWAVQTVGHVALAASAPEVAAPALELGPTWLQQMASVGFDPREHAFQAAEAFVWNQGEVQDQLLLRSGTWVGFQAVLLLTLQPLRTVAIFLLGAQLWRAGLFRRVDGQRLRRRLALWGLGAGLPAEALVVGLHVVAGFDEMHPLAVVAESLHYVSGIGVGLGLAAAVTGLALSPRAGRLVAPLASAGRMALTCYLSHSLIGGLLVAAVGFGVVHRAWHLPLAVGIVAAQVLLCSIWLRHFRMGPVEWLWRAGTTGSLPPFLGAAR